MMHNQLRRRVARLEETVKSPVDLKAAHRYFQLCQHLEVQAPEPLPGELGPEYLARLSTPTILAMHCAWAEEYAATL